MNSEALLLSTDARLMINSKRFSLVFQPQRSERILGVGQGSSRESAVVALGRRAAQQAWGTWPARRDPPFLSGILQWALLASG